MTILRCNKCGHLEELPQESAGTTLPCPRCRTPVQAYDTVLFVGKVLEKLFAMQSEVVRLRSAAGGGEPPRTGVATSTSHGFDPHNSRALSTPLQHGPIQDWFQQRQIQVRTNPKAVDTTGFFDEVAVALGKDFSVLKEVVDRVRFAQLKGFASTTIHLERKTPEQAQLISGFCRQLYEYSFVAKCFHPKDDKLPLRLVLQTAPAIRDFFNGDWLEWLVFMVMLELARDHGRRYSCARNLVITLQNDETFELDVFFLLDGNRPVCIECKSGEFRQDIDRCLTLRKRMGIGRGDFILCAVGLGADQAQGLSSMYDLTFINEQDLRGRLASLFSAQVESRLSARTA
jgi:hypothetical protein